MKVKWSGKPNIHVEANDEILVMRGFGDRDSSEVSATMIGNITKGIIAKSDVEGVLASRTPNDFTPPIQGYAKYILMIGDVTTFTLEEKTIPIVSNILRECKKFIDSKLYDRCIDKDYHDVLTNAFPILEDRIRAKIGVDKSYYGKKLINHAFNPKTGKLILGETPSEQESIYLLFNGAIGFLRNPTSHSLMEDESNIESFEIICMVDLLLKFVKKAKLRS